jgi:hypothetical protein
MQEAPDRRKQSWPGARRVGGWLAACCLVATVPRNARADNANPNVIPLGQNESFLGNTGVGRPDDTGAVYYNPAGLAEVGAGQVSLSGTVYASVHEHYDGFIAVENTNVPLDESGFEAIPTALVLTRPLGDWVGAFSVLVPISFQFDDHTALAVPNLPTNLIYSTSETEARYGLSIARKLGQRFAVGLSVFGIQHMESIILGLDTVNPSTGAFATVLERENLSIYGLLATLGISYVASDAVRFGLRMQTAMAQIYGKGESYSITRGAAPMATPLPSENVSGPANYGIPFDFSLGTAVKPTEWLTLLGDVSLQLPTSYQEFPASINNETVTLKTTPRFNVGVEALPAPANPVRLGFYYVPSARSGEPGDPGFQRLDYYGLTAGVAMNREHVRTSVGGFYIWANGQATSTAPASAAVSVSGVGAMITTAYVF